MCCCTPEHRCPTAWRLITTAVQARQQRDHEQVRQMRHTYTQHLITARLLTPGGEAWPDSCPITLDDDPRCPACTPSPPPLTSSP